MPTSLPFPRSLEPVAAFSGTLSTRSYVVRAGSLAECREALEVAKARGLTVCPRGTGLSYADMILNDGQLILELTGMSGPVEWDPGSGRMTALPGVRLADVLNISLPNRWTPNACPGGMEATLGGAISNNIHGKDAWRVGNFGSQVVALKLLRADGVIVTVSRDHDPELFRAVIGGLGLLGVVVEITLQLTRIPSAFVEATPISTRNMRETLARLDESTGWDYSVAWVDAFARDQGLGRGYVALARWVDSDEKVDPERLRCSLTKSTRVFDLFPSRPFWTLARPVFLPFAIRQLNRITYRLGRRRSGTVRRQLFTEYNFIHNRIPNIEQVYRPQGFIELQPIIPRKCGHDAVAELLRLCQSFRAESLVCGVKRHRPDDFMLSYEGDGYSVGIDIQLRGRDSREVEAFARRVYEFTAEVGGKVYLAKDQFLPRDLFERMYPGVERFRSVRRQVDPGRLFMSDMARRLDL